MHVVYRGPFIPQAWLSRAAAASGFGRIADIRRAHPKLMSYLAKYLTKGLGPATPTDSAASSHERVAIDPSGRSESVGLSVHAKMRRGPFPE